MAVADPKSISINARTQPLPQATIPAIASQLVQNELNSPAQVCDGELLQALQSRSHEDKIIWGDVRRIDRELLLTLAVSVLSTKGLFKSSDGDLQLVDRLEGSYNSVSVIQLPSGVKYCIRVPAAGRPDCWTEEDATLLEADAKTMCYIKRKSGLLMPEIVSFDSTCNNEIGHPYLFTTFIQGRPVYQLWDDDTHSDLEGLRQNILKSTATEISKLRCMTWKLGMGMLNFEHEDNPMPSWTVEVDEGFPWEDDCGLRRELVEVQKALLSIIDYRETMQELYMEHTPKWIGNSSEAKWRQGEQIFLNLMIHCLPDAEDYDVTTVQPKIGSLSWLQLSQPLETLKHTTMTIAPPDFNMQNIMVDDDGNVTGFLDWDCTQVVPCYRGWARYPKWLYRDYSLYFDNDQDLFWDSKELEGYRQNYARYMVEAMDGKGDCLFTSKSHLYEVLHEALRLRIRRQDFVDKVLAILYPRVDPVLFLERLQATESKEQQGLKRKEMVVLWERLQQLFAPVVGPDLRFSF